MLLEKRDQDIKEKDKKNEQRLMEVDAEYDTITHRMFMDKLARDIKESEEKVREEREAKILEFQNEDRELKRLANELEEKKNMIADLTKELKEIPLNDN